MWLQDDDRRALLSSKNETVRESRLDMSMLSASVLRHTTSALYRDRRFVSSGLGMKKDANRRAVSCLESQVQRETDVFVTQVCPTCREPSVAQAAGARRQMMDERHFSGYRQRPVNNATYYYYQDRGFAVTAGPKAKLKLIGSAGCHENSPLPLWLICQGRVGQSQQASSNIPCSR